MSLVGFLLEVLETVPEPSRRWTCFSDVREGAEVRGAAEVRLSAACVVRVVRLGRESGRV